MFLLPNSNTIVIFKVWEFSKVNVCPTALLASSKNNSAMPFEIAITLGLLKALDAFPSKILKENILK